MNQSITIKLKALAIIAAAIVSGACYFSVKPVYNDKNTSVQATPAPQVKTVQNRDDLKAKGLAAVNTLHELMQQRKFEDAYQMIDDKSALKNPKPEALDNLKEIVDVLGKLKKKELTMDKVVEDQGQLQIRQEFIVDYEKDTPTPKRYEIFIWNIYPDGSIKLWNYINSKGDD